MNNQNIANGKLLLRKIDVNGVQLDECRVLIRISEKGQDLAWTVIPPDLWENKIEFKQFLENLVGEQII